LSVDSRPIDPSLQEHDKNQGIERSQLLSSVLSSRIFLHSRPFKICEFRVPRSRSLAPRTRRKYDHLKNVRLSATRREFGPIDHISIPAPDTSAALRIAAIDS